MKEAFAMKKCIFPLICFAAVLVSCESELHGNFNREIFNHERQLWLEQDIQNYSYRQFNGTQSLKRSAIMYLKDSVLFYIWLEGRDEGFFLTEVELGAQKNGVYIPPFFAETITGIYAEIERLSNLAGPGDTIEIQYDSEWHYPASFLVRWAKGNFRMVEVGKFTVDPEYPTR